RPKNTTSYSSARCARRSAQAIRGAWTFEARRDTQKRSESVQVLRFAEGHGPIQSTLDEIRRNATRSLQRRGRLFVISESDLRRCEEHVTGCEIRRFGNSKQRVLGCPSIVATEKICLRQVMICAVLDGVARIGAKCLMQIVQAAFQIACRHL